MKPNEVDELSPNEVWIVIDAYHEDQQAEWERTRVIAYNIHIHAPYMKKKSHSITAFLPFPWDKKQLSRTQQLLQRHLENKKNKDAC